MLSVFLAQAAVPAADALAKTASSAPSIQWYSVLLLIIYFVVCVSLVVLVTCQVSKADGMAGFMGGSTQNMFRGKESGEETLSKITNWLGVAFIVLSILINISLR